MDWIVLGKDIDWIVLGKDLDWIGLGLRIKNRSRIWSKGGGLGEDGQADRAWFWPEP